MSTAARAAGVVDICCSSRRSERRHAAQVPTDQPRESLRREGLLAGQVGLAGHVMLGRGRAQADSTLAVADHDDHRLDGGDRAEGDGVRTGERDGLGPRLDGDDLHDSPFRAG